MASQRNIIFFDGYCSLCNGFVDWMIRRDPKHALAFASLQGETAKRLLPPDALSAGDSETVLFLCDAGLFERSSAVLRAVGELGGIWRLSVLFRIFPAFLRDAVYRVIARNRYRWFGKRDTCRLPSPEEKAYLLP